MAEIGSSKHDSLKSRTLDFHQESEVCYVVPWDELRSVRLLLGRRALLLEDGKLLELGQKRRKAAVHLLSSENLGVCRAQDGIRHRLKIVYSSRGDRFSYVYAPKVWRNGRKLCGRRSLGVDGQLAADTIRNLGVKFDVVFLKIKEVQTLSINSARVGCVCVEACWAIDPSDVDTISDAFCFLEIEEIDEVLELCRFQQTSFGRWLLPFLATVSHQDNNKTREAMRRFRHEREWSCGDLRILRQRGIRIVKSWDFPE